MDDLVYHGVLVAVVFPGMGTFCRMDLMETHTRMVGLGARTLGAILVIVRSMIRSHWLGRGALRRNRIAGIASLGLATCRR